jgi:putative redox protein
MRASVQWQDGMVFEGLTETGFRITTAAAPPGGEPEQGARPMELVLVAAGACTAMDVAGILRKMRQPFDGLTVEVDADRAADHPRVFTAIRLSYTVRGRGLDPAQVEKAIRLSQERYCSVAAMLRPSVPLSYAWRLEPGEDEEADRVA